MIEALERTRLLVGDDGLSRLQSARVIVFGVGGVGSWAVEALARTGIGDLTIVDMDDVAPSNLNRQLVASVSAIGSPKAQVLKTRLADVAPTCSVTALSRRYSAEDADSFDLPSYDYVIDAIDSLSDKADLIRRVADIEGGPTLFSSMGAARKLDSTQVQVADFWKVNGCPLARALRKKFKREKTAPSKGFLCIFSPEQGENKVESPDGANGSIAHVTGVFGLFLANLVVNDILSK